MLGPPPATEGGSHRLGHEGLLPQALGTFGLLWSEFATRTSSVETTN